MFSPLRTYLPLPIYMVKTKVAIDLIHFIGQLKQHIER